MSRTIIELEKPWGGAPPQLAWIMQLTAGSAGGFSYGNARKVAGEAIDIEAELKAGAGERPAEFQSGKESQGNPPSALSLTGNETMYLGLELVGPKELEFDAAGPFSQGDAKAEQGFFNSVRIAPNLAYVIVNASEFGKEFVRKFNIHVVSNGSFPDGSASTTPIIIDPDVRIPPPGYNPPG